MKKNSNPVSSLKSKRLRYGAYSTLICVFVITVLILLNIVVSMFDISFDLTLDKRYTISKESIDILSAVTENVTIYALLKEGDANLQYEQLLAQYEQASRNVKVEYKDPYLHPTFVNNFRTDNTEIPAGSIIVTSDSRYRVIRIDELFTFEFDPYTGNQYIKSFDLEPRVTNAVRFVTNDISTFIYHVTNHNEAPLPESIKKQISIANYDIAELNLFEAEKIPDNADMLILTTPGRDYTVEETQKVLNYLQQGGRAIICADTTVNRNNNYISIINAYCVEFAENLVIEGNLAGSFSGTPYYLLPSFADHEITNNLARNTNVLMMYASSLHPASNMRSSVTIEPLLVTSRSSYSKTGDFQSLNKEPNDADGPFAVAVAVTDESYMPEHMLTKVVITSSSGLFSDSANSLVSGGNGDFALNAVNWLIGRDDSIYIRPKVNFVLGNLIINDMHGRALQAGSMFVLPGLILVTGIIVWKRRRNR